VRRTIFGQITDITTAGAPFKGIKNGSLGIFVVERIYGGILVVPPPKYPHIFH
jgi:hypothetical protein